MIYMDKKSFEHLKRQTGNHALAVLKPEYLLETVKINNDPTGIPIYLYLTHYNYPTQQIQLMQETELSDEEEEHVSIGYSFPLHESPNMIDALTNTLNWFADSYQGNYQHLIRKKVEDQNFAGFYFAPMRKLFISVLIPSDIKDETKHLHSFTGCLDYVRKNRLFLDPFSKSMLEFMERQGLI